MWPDSPLLPASASSFSPEIDGLFLLLSAVGVLFTCGIFATVLVLCIAFRARSGRADEPEGPVSPAFRALWTALPLAVVLTIFFWSTRIQTAQASAPSDSIEVRAIGRQWRWNFEHEGGPTEINSLHVPVNVPVKLRLASEDVIHRFSVPAFRIQQDVLPGEETWTWFRPTRQGTYHLFCTEYCGTGHSDMAGTVYVLDPITYEHWVIGDSANLTPEEAGELIFAAFRCESCHAPGGGGTGPSLLGRWGSEVALEDGSTAAFDAAYVRESVLEPRAKLAAGYQPVMTSYKGQLDESQIAQLAAYLESLGSDSSAGGQ